MAGNEVVLTLEQFDQVAAAVTAKWKDIPGWGVLTEAFDEVRAELGYPRGNAWDEPHLPRRPLEIDRTGVGSTYAEKSWVGGSPGGFTDYSQRLDEDVDGLKALIQTFAGLPEKVEGLLTDVAFLKAQRVADQARRVKPGIDSDPIPLEQAIPSFARHETAIAELQAAEASQHDLLCQTVEKCGDLARLVQQLVKDRDGKACDDVMRNARLDAHSDWLSKLEGDGNIREDAVTARLSAVEQMTLQCKGILDNHFRRMEKLDARQSTTDLSATQALTAIGSLKQTVADLDQLVGRLHKRLDNHSLVGHTPNVDIAA